MEAKLGYGGRTSPPRAGRWRPATAPALAALVLLAAVQPRHAQSNDAAQVGGAKEEIRRLRELSNAAIARHDTAGIAASLATNVVVVSSTSSQTVGRDANARGFAEIFLARPDVTYRRTPDAIDVFIPWRMASERGRWTGSWSDAGGKVSIGGAYFAKWRRIGGAWRIESETYVPDHCEGGKYCAQVP